MASRKEEFSFMVSRFKGFWRQYRRSKRGVLGLGIIIFFGAVAVFAPLLSPLDPLKPKMKGYYPGQQPKLAEKLCLPIWYKTLLGRTELSENMLLVEDHEFNSYDLFDAQFNWQATPQANITIQQRSTGGNHNDDGCIAITYIREESEARPEENKTTVTLLLEFEYPYQGAPVSLWWHQSLHLENRTPIEATFPVNRTLRYRRGDEPDTIQVEKFDFSMFYIGGDIGGGWYSSAGTTDEVTTLLTEIFTKAGNYTVEFVFEMTDLSESADYTLYIDDLQIIQYGRAFGLLGTSSIPKATPRDLYTMLIYGTRISFMIGLLTAIFSVLIGLFVGLVAGYLRGLVDEGLMRFADFLLVLPGLPLLIVLVMVLGPSIWNIIGVLIFMGWMGFSRTVRSMVLSLRERPFIESAKASGGSAGYIIYRHILPNVFALVYISLATSVPGAIISEASLAWLGLGDINIPSWGVMLYDFSRESTALIKSLGEYWFWVIPPGVAIALMAMSFILMGFALDEILNPKLRKRR